MIALHRLADVVEQDGKPEQPFVFQGLVDAANVKVGLAAEFIERAQGEQYVLVHGEFMIALVFHFAKEGRKCRDDPGKDAGFVHDAQNAAGVPVLRYDVEEQAVDGRCPEILRRKDCIAVRM